MHERLTPEQTQTISNVLWKRVQLTLDHFDGMPVFPDDWTIISRNLTASFTRIRAYSDAHNLFVKMYAPVKGDLPQRVAQSITEMNELSAFCPILPLMEHTPNTHFFQLGKVVSEDVKLIDVYGSLFVDKLKQIAGRNYLNLSAHVCMIQINDRDYTTDVLDDS